MGEKEGRGKAMKEEPADKRESKQRTTVCDDCGKEIEENDIWYPFFDISRHGGGTK